MFHYNIKKIFLILFGVLLPIITFAQELKNPLGDDNNDPRVVIGMAIQGALGILGSLALATFIYGGFIWMLSGGSAERIEKGKKILVWAVIGLVIILTSYIIVNFIFGEGVASLFIII